MSFSDRYQYPTFGSYEVFGRDVFWSLCR